MSIQIIDPLTYPNYDALLLERNDSSIFHSSSWARVLNKAYNYRPLYFSILENGNFEALLALMEVKSFLTGSRAVSLPFTDYCHPLPSENKEFEALFDKLTFYGRKAKWKTCEIRGEASFHANASPFSYYYLHELKLKSNKKTIFSKFRSSTRRNIIKAERSRVTANICHSWDSMQDYYRLHCTTRKKHGIPPQPFYFFKEVYNHIISPGKGFVVLARYDSKPIAGAVYFHFGQNAVYKYGASDRRFAPLRANNLVMWTAIKWYIQNRYESFSFGRTHPKNSGLIQFKRGWASEEKKISYFKYDFLKQCFIKEQPKTQILYFFFRNLPAPVLNLTGRLLYRHVG